MQSTQEIKTLIAEDLGASEGHTIGVLDQGFVRLVDWLGSDLSIVRAARVSHASDWRAGKDTGSDERLIRYLMRHGHTSPFESVVFTFEVKAPIFVLRQWHRHRTQSYNEVSARYTELPDEFYVPVPEDVGVPHPTNKQARITGDELTNDQRAAAEASVGIIRGACAGSFEVYHALLARGVPRELARGVLPVNTYSRMFTTVSLHNLFRFLRERLSPGAQLEIRRYAEALLLIAEQVTPVAVAAFQESLTEGGVK